MQNGTNKCARCGTTFEITDDDRSFYEKMQVPAPTLCPDCRQQRRLCFRNFRHLYNRKCDLTGKQIISMYQADSPFPVYDLEAWWSDQWDGKDYGIEFDFQKTFFEQYKTLQEHVPKFAVHNVDSENCHYSNMVRGSRNCYLVFGCIQNEDSYYGHIVWQSKNCLDCLYISNCELCYEAVDCLKSYNLRYARDCENCIDSSFILNCRSVKNCFGCIGLNNKEFHIFNKAYSKEEYQRIMAKFDFCNPTHVQKAQETLNDLAKHFPHRYYEVSQCEDCSGNYLYNSKNIQHGFDVKKSEDSKFLYTVHSQKNCYDISFTGAPIELGYENLFAQGYNIRFSHLCLNENTNLTYCDACFGCRDCFGCVGLKKQQYCILNKQYTKEEYHALIPKIMDHMKKTGEWGEFFPVQLSPFAYNETMAQEYFPLTREQAIRFGMTWKEDDIASRYQGTPVSIPSDIEEVPDSITKQILTCENCGRNYKIISQELKFYREMKLPIPHQCFECRHNRRMSLRNPRKLWNRACMKCGTAIQTSYAPDRKEIVYCEKCYQENVY